MASTSAKRKISILFVLNVIIICFFCVCALTACNNGGSEIKEVEKQYGLYFSDILYSQDDNTMYAVVTLKGNDDNKLKEKLDWQSRTYALNVWYKRQDVVMTDNTSDIYNEIDSLISDEQREYNGAQYNALKIILRYDTIYKSINSDVNAVKNGRNYLHDFYLDKDNESQICAVWLKSPNTANWYILLIGCGIVFVVSITGIALFIKGGVWQKKKKKNG